MKNLANYILLASFFALISSCSQYYVTDNGAPKAWSDSRSGGIKSMYLLILPAIYDEPYLEQMKLEAKEALESKGIDVEVEIFDRLALESTSDRFERIEDAEKDVYVEIRLTKLYPGVGHYKMIFKNSPSSDEPFYVMNFSYPYQSNGLDGQSTFMKEISQLIVEKLEERRLIR